MLQGGTIEYAETRKIAEYENKTAKVILTFSFEGAKDPDDLLDQIMQNAKVRVHTALGIKSTIELPTRGPGRPPKAKPAEEPKPEPKKASKPAEPKDEDADLFEDAGEEVDETEADVPEITDQELTDAVKAKAAETKDPERLKKFIWDAVGKQGASVRQLPQDKRAAFLKQLAKLKKEDKKVKSEDEDL